MSHDDVLADCVGAAGLCQLRCRPRCGGTSPRPSPQSGVAGKGSRMKQNAVDRTVTRIAGKHRLLLLATTQCCAAQASLGVHAWAVAERHFCTAGRWLSADDASLTRRSRVGPFAGLAHGGDMSSHVPHAHGALPQRASTTADGRQVLAQPPLRMRACSRLAGGQRLKPARRGAELPLWQRMAPTGHTCGSRTS